MKKCMFGFGLGSLKSQKTDPVFLPVSAMDLARLGIPARKIPRILHELQRAAEHSPRLKERTALLRMARALDRVLP